MERLLLVLADPVKLEKKLFSLVEEFGKLAGIEDLGWALLAKLVYGCDQGMLKAIASRIQKRLIAAVKQPIRIPLLHFIRSFLVRFPWLKACNEQTLASICIRAVDFAVENFSVDITRLTSDVYALWAGTKYDHLLIKALKNVLSNSIAEEMEGSILHFETASQRHRPHFIATLFTLHTFVMKRCESGVEIEINKWLDVAREALTVGDVEIDVSVFKWLETFILRAGSCALIASRRISSLFFDYYRPSEAYYRAVKEFIQLGFGSNANSFFGTLIHSVSEHLQSVEYGMAYAEAVGVLLVQRPYLLYVQDVIQLQHAVCREAYRNRNCRPALSLLNSLLAANHEFVPTPIQIAHSIFSGSRAWCEEVRQGRALCSSISRPRIQTLVPQEILLKKLNNIMTDGVKIHYESSQFLTRTTMYENSEDPLVSGSVENEVNQNDSTEETVNHESDNVGKDGNFFENGARKRGRISFKNSLTKRVRIASQSEDTGFSVGESFSTSGMMEFTDGKVLKKEDPLAKIEKSEDTVVVGARGVKGCDADVSFIPDRAENTSCLSVHQMMADFMPV